MGTRDARVDAYIEKSADFAKPILTHLRTVVHAGCPDVVETIKWSMPHFEHRGLLCSMAAFKGHCTLNFWRRSLVVGDAAPSDEAMGQFGRITSVRDLPPERTLRALVKKAAALNESGVATPRAPRARSAREVVVPEDLAAALRRNKKARAGFDAFTPSQKRDYIEWLDEAKRADTRARRLETAVAQMAEGKTRNWKYETR